MPRPRLRILLVVALALGGPAWATGTVTLPLEDYLALRGPEPEKPPKPPDPAVADRTVTITPVEGGLHVSATWRIEAPAPGWFGAQLAGPNVRVEKATWNGGPAGVTSAPDGSHLTGRVVGSAVVGLEAFVAGDPTQQDVLVALMPSPRGRVRVITAGEDAGGHLGRPGGGHEAMAARLGAVDGPAPVRSRGDWWSGAAAFTVRMEAPHAIGPRPTLVVAQTAVGLTVGDAELRGHARVVWQVRQGAVSEVSFVASGVGDDVQVSGDGFAGVDRSGDTFVVRLRAPEKRRVEVQLSWSEAISAGAEASLRVPDVHPTDAWRNDTVLQVARDAEIEVVPAIAGADAVPASALPPEAEGLVDGTPTAAFHARTQLTGTLQLLRFTPVEEPACVVDVAEYTVALTDEGRSLVRAYLQVRNERAAHLRVTAPPGMKIIGVRVGTDTVVPAKDGDAWLVPLRRSVETVQGLITFPVEIVLLGDDGQDWTRKAERGLALPVYDAPVAVTRATVHLPPGYGNRLHAGEGDVVDAFTEGEGITYGLAAGDDARLAEVDQTFQEAVSDWMNNDFDAAQQKLDALKSQGAENENTKRLQSNLDVVSGKKGEVEDTAETRRVKDQARARASSEEQAQQDLLHKADEQLASGDYEAASSSYKQAVDIGGKLAGLEQNESVEISTRNDVARQKYAEAEKKKEKKEADDKAVADEDDERAADEKVTAKTPAVSDGPATGQTVTGTFEFDGTEVDGELAVPGGTSSVSLAGATDSTTTTATTTTETPAPDAAPTPPPETPEPEPTVVDEDYLENVPAERSYDTADIEIAERRPIVPRVHLGGGAKKAPEPVQAAAASPGPASITIGGNSADEPVVYASAVTVIVPAMGETVRYQHLLLDPDAPLVLRVEGKRSRSKSDG